MNWNWGFLICEVSKPVKSLLSQPLNKYAILYCSVQYHSIPWHTNTCYAIPYHTIPYHTIHTIPYCIIHVLYFQVRTQAYDDYFYMPSDYSDYELTKRHLGAALKHRLEDKRHLGAALSQRLSEEKRHLGPSLNHRYAWGNSEKRSIGPALNVRYKTWRYTGELGNNKRQNGWSHKYGSFYPFYDQPRNRGSAPYTRLVVIFISRHPWTTNRGFSISGRFLSCPQQKLLCRTATIMYQSYSTLYCKIKMSQIHMKSNGISLQVVVCWYRSVS